MPNRNKIFQVEKNLGFPNNNFFIAFVVFSGCVHGNSGSNPKSIDYTVRYFYKADGSGTKTAAFFPKVHFGTKAYFESTKNELSAFLNKDAAGGAIVIEQVICTSSTLGLNIETFAEELIPRTEGMTKEAYRDKLVTSLAQIRAKDLLLDETCKDNMSPKMMAARDSYKTRHPQKQGELNIFYQYDVLDFSKFEKATSIWGDVDLGSAPEEIQFIRALIFENEIQKSIKKRSTKGQEYLNWFQKSESIDLMYQIWDDYRKKTLKNSIRDAVTQFNSIAIPWGVLYEKEVVPELAAIGFKEDAKQNRIIRYGSCEQILESSLKNIYEDQCN